MFVLPTLKYEYNALEPFVDGKTMEIHHSKHHQGYINKLNTALQADPEKLNMNLADLILHKDSFDPAIKKAVTNFGGGHYNHKMFFDLLSPTPGEMSSELAQQVNQDFASKDAMLEEFFNTAAGVFGSGWAWLVKNQDGSLTVQTSVNQDTPLTATQKPIMVIDLWEHAYYLQYQNRRPEFIKAFLSILDWQEVSKNYSA